jgi:uncharacterized lipoprotein YbaY
LTTNNKPLVTGNIIIFDKDDKLLKSFDSFPNATVFIRLIDVSVVDAASKVVLEKVIKNIDYCKDTSRSQGRKFFSMPFRLYGKISDNQARYAISIHIDMDGDGIVSIGDYINMQSYPVITHGNPKYVSVKVKQIN